MKKVMIVLILLSLIVSFVSAKTIKMVAPEFMQSNFDAYSYNYINAKTTGMGNTGVATFGGIQYSLKNPASFKTENLSLYVEALFKVEADELAEYEEFEQDYNSRDDEFEYIVERGNQNYVSKIPFGIIGFGKKMAKNLNVGLSFSQANSITYDNFSRKTAGDNTQVIREPTYYNWQTALTTSYQIADFSLGLNIINNTYQFNEYRLEGSYEVKNFTENLIRFKPGIIYGKNNWSVGFSYLLPAEKQIDCTSDTIMFSYDSTSVKEGLSFDTKLPSKLTTGFTYRYREYLFQTDLEYDFTSQQSSHFDDRIKYGIGLQKDMGAYRLRGGFLYSSGIFSGAFDNPYVYNSDAQQYYDKYIIEVDKEKDFWLTAGAGWKTKYVDIDVSLMKDVIGNLKGFQATTGFTIK